MTNVYVHTNIDFSLSHFLDIRYAVNRLRRSGMQEHIFQIGSDATQIPSLDHDGQIFGVHVFLYLVYHRRS